MTTSIASLNVAATLAAPAKKKRVLLVDTSRAKRDTRAETMRRLGVDVDCAADITEARCWWRPELYDLVLFHVEHEVPHMYKFWDEIVANTGQQVAFLVGKPAYLASSPTPASGKDEAEAGPAPLLPGSGSAIGSPAVPQNWGILEACRRISAVRSIADARSRALRDKPLPPRDTVADDAGNAISSKWKFPQDQPV